jgi:hypothetical protein
MTTAYCTPRQKATVKKWINYPGTQLGAVPAHLNAKRSWLFRSKPVLESTACLGTAAIMASVGQTAASGLGSLAMQRQINNYDFSRNRRTL